MKTTVLLTDSPLQLPALTELGGIPATVGAVVHFLGVVRGEEDAAPIRALFYEAHPPMVHHQFELIFERIRTQWAIDSLRLVHRVGEVPVGEASLWVEVRSAHRGEAFAACQFLIDEMKKLVPVWKRPVWTDESSTNPLS